MTRLVRDTGGNALIGFALLLPVLLGFCFGILEFSLLAFDFHRANEATRRIARQATMIQPLVSETTLNNNGTTTCTGAGCDGLAELTAAANAIHSATILREITPDNVAIIYSVTDIGGPDIPTAAKKPLITVRLTGLEHDFILLGSLRGFFPNAPTGITLPAFSTSMLGLGYQS